jgi:Zn-dependent protease
MFKNALYVGRVFGIPLRIHVSWLIIFVLITFGLAAGYFPREYPREKYPEWTPQLYWVIGFATSILFFVSVLLHELAHSLLARARGLAVHDIVLFIFGGVSEISDETKNPATEFFVAFIGPLTSFVLAGLFYGLWFVARPLSGPVAALGWYLGFINGMLGAFNLIPGFPLDGGRVLRSILWKATGNLEKSTRWAARSGQVVAYLFILFGIWLAIYHDLLNGLWIAFIGWFLDNAALSSYRQLIIRQTLSEHTVSEIMMRDYPQTSPDVPLSAVVEEYLLPYGLRCLPVVTDGRLVGLLTVHDLQKVPREQWPMTPTSQIMIPMERVKVTGPGENLWHALEEMTQEGVNQLPVLTEGRLEGLLTRAGVLTFLRTKAELGI